MSESKSLKIETIKVYRESGDIKELIIPFPELNEKDLKWKDVCGEGEIFEVE